MKAITNQLNVYSLFVYTPLDVNITSKIHQNMAELLNYFVINKINIKKVEKLYNTMLDSFNMNSYFQ